MVTHISHSALDTQRLGESWGQGAPSGWLIGLSGELGAGKTQLVKGLARGLDITERVHSPTFALINEYSGGRLPLHHLDLYRLETPGQIQSAGLDEYLLKPRGVTVAEWIEHWLPWLPEMIKPATPIVRDSLRRLLRSAGLPEMTKPATPSPAPPCRLVYLDTLSEHQRRIIYEDFGA